MKRTVYIGFDPRDWAGYQVAVESLRHYSGDQVNIVPLVERDLRAKGYRRSYRVDDKGQMWDESDGKPFSTQFSFTRFCVPALANFRNEWVLFVDADVMFRADVTELFDLADDRYAVMCVQHNHRPAERFKMDGVLQTLYWRKNWSSVMLINPARCHALTMDVASTWAGQRLHALDWIPEEQIGSLPLAWNWLDGDGYDMAPKLLHYTRGTPDMIAGTAYEDEWWSHFQMAAVEYPLIRRREHAAT